MPNNARQLVDSLQSGTPRQFGFVRPSAPWQVTLGGAERCSLAYKLAAQPSATLNLVPALQAAGGVIATAGCAYNRRRGCAAHAARHHQRAGCKH